MKRKIILGFVSFCLLFTIFSTANEVFGQDKRKLKQAMKIVAEGDAVFQQKNYRGAIDKYSEAIVLYPTLPQAHFWKGYAHYYLKEYDQAVPDLDKALAQGYKPLDVYSVRWFVNYQRKNYDLALDDAQNGLKLDPKNQEFNNAVAELLFAKGSYQEALELFQKTIQVNPDKADAYITLQLHTPGWAILKSSCPQRPRQLKKTRNF